MLRIAVSGIRPEDVQQVGLRLRGAMVEHWPDIEAGGPIWESAEAVAIFGEGRRTIDLLSRALAARKHVLIAAHSGLAVAQLEKLAAIAKEHDVRLAVENPDHALPSRRLIRQQIEDGKLGDVGLVRIVRGEPAAAPGDSGASLPAGLIGDLELATWIVGRAPDALYAVRQRNPSSNRPHAETVQVHLGFPNGGMALVTWSSVWCSPDAHHSVSVIASTGAAYLDDAQNRQLLYGEGETTAPVADEGPVTTAVLQQFVDGIKSGRAAGNGLDSWRRVAQVVAAVEQSLATEQAVSLRVN